MLLAMLTTLIITIFFGPFFIRKLYELKIGQPIRTKEECPHLAELHSKKKNTPTMGGILILLSLTISLFLFMDLKNSFTWLLLLTMLSLGTIGAIDDFLKLKLKTSDGMRAKTKFVFQLLFASFVALYLLVPTITNSISKIGIHPPIAKELSISKTTKDKNITTLSCKEYVSRFYVPFLKTPLFNLNMLLTFLLIIVTIVGSSNAVNLADGLDGLASGCLILVALVLAIFAFLSNNIQIARYLNIIYIEGSGEIAVFLVALIGALLGFLWYNSFPAQMFMGDVGSLALGGIIGIVSVLLSREILLALIGGIFVVEALSVIIQVASYKYRNKKRVFLCSPLHHHFEYKGWAETKVVMRFWIVGLILAIIGIASLKFQ
jgi:phospho-N-acetylmuramoyl-pentapeptide-transferase